MIRVQSLCSLCLALHKALRYQDLGGKLAETLLGDGGDGKRGSDRPGRPPGSQELGFNSYPKQGKSLMNHGLL